MRNEELETKLFNTTKKCWSMKLIIKEQQTLIQALNLERDEYQQFM